MYFQTKYVHLLNELQCAQDVLATDVRISSFRGSCYGLWLEKRKGPWSLVQRESWQGSFDMLEQGKADVLAGVVGLLEGVQQRLSGSWKVLPGSFMTVPQAIGFPLNRTNQVGEVVKYLRCKCTDNTDYLYYCRLFLNTHENHRVPK